MKLLHRVLLSVLCSAAAAPALATDVGVSVSVNKPGLYGRIDINQPPPPVALIAPQPVVIAPSPVAVYQQPIYLYVPPGHAKHWGKHCHQYNACGQPVYFVRDNWYREHYVHPQPVVVQPVQPVQQVVAPPPTVIVRERDGDRGHGHGHGRGHGRHGD
ncbi:MAG TPA: hypothetical protein VFP68_05005 [Burkholderiaceae bacterium]|nr:hypothetical protein [Burkholderiaceae bacterium]